MMRRPVKNRNIPGPDSIYNSQKIGRLINYVMLDGRKETARAVVYQALERIKKESENPNPLEVVDLAFKNAGPALEVRSRRVGGANYQVPREVRPERRLALAMRWIMEAARKKKGQPMYIKLSDEIILASKNEGEAVKRKENTLKMAEANKAFAHFAW
ncbi:MAG: 30S ribosomal protein S7 [Candidatus Pacebacteria bacterium]|nr:30S ribosomal protein S7 [Candidatus Paceibacterota bacterium]